MNTVAGANARPLSVALPANIRQTVSVRTRIGGEFLRYLFASGLALALDVMVFSLGMRVMGLPWAVSAPLGFVVGATCAYLLSIRFVFVDRSLERSPRFEFVSFVLIGIVGLGITQLILWVGIELMSLNAELSKLAAAGITFLCNFMLRKVFLFSRRVAVK